MGARKATILPEALGSLLALLGGVRGSFRGAQG